MRREDTPQTHLLSSIHADGRRMAIHPADVEGRCIRRRRWTFYALIAIYVALPLIHVNGHPAVQLDVAGRRFYLFGSTFNAQDFWLALFVVTTVAFALLFITAWLGRAWCGWACPQTVFLEGVYRRIERMIEGPRERRLRRAAGPWDLGRGLRAVARHAGYLAVSWVLAHVALALFVSFKDLRQMVINGPRGNEVPFAWAVVTTGLLYFNFAHFREQLCVLVCPYGRLQSALTDRHSLIVGYDAKRGEPRGRLEKSVSLRTFGDCVDCRKCITACPTGIDIRNGLQLECVACAQCVDACDDVMSRIGRPAGLIRFDSLNGLSGEKKWTWRPRLVAYGALFLASATALGVGLGMRSPFEANLLRAGGMPYTVEAETVRNQFELHLVNKNPGDASFDIAVTAEVPVQAVVAPPHLTLPSLRSQRVPIFVSVDRAAFHRAFAVQVEVTDHASGKTRKVEARFLGPKG